MEPEAEVSMNCELIVDLASLCTGLLSAVFWVISAVIKVAPPPSLVGKPDDSYWDGIVVNGGDLLKTMRAQSKWNSLAAFAAAATAVLQIVARYI
jgi:hypothetical protein